MIVEMHTLMQKKIWMKNIFSSWRFLILKILIFWKRIWFFQKSKILRFFKNRKIPKFSIFEKSDFFSKNHNFQNKKSSRWKNIFRSDFFLHQSMHLYYPKNWFRASGHVFGGRGSCLVSHQRKIAKTCKFRVPEPQKRSRKLAWSECTTGELFLQWGRVF